MSRRSASAGEWRPAPDDKETRSRARLTAARLVVAVLVAAGVIFLVPMAISGLFADKEEARYVTTTLLVGFAAIGLAWAAVGQMKDDLKTARMGKESRRKDEDPIPKRSTRAEGLLPWAELKLARVDLREAVLPRIELSDAELTGALLERASLNASRLRGARLAAADLRGADLRGADLSDADLRDADLRNADLRGANLRGASMDGTELGGARWDRTTAWPADRRGPVAAGDEEAR